MERRLLKLFSRLAIAMVIIVTAAFLWNKWLAYYWHTDVLHLYQGGDSFRLCDGVEQLLPSWAPNEEYSLHVSEAEKAISLGQPISIIARGVVSETGSDVYIDKIIDIIVGIDIKCEEKY